MEFFTTGHHARPCSRRSRATARFEDGRCRNVSAGSGSRRRWHVAWLNFTESGPERRGRCRADPNHPLTPDEIPVHGFIYDVGTGRLNEVKEAMAVG